jgi:thiamine-monophosphate kinase
MPADEFDVIRKLFAPLATSAGARGLIDDVAVLEARGTLVVTTDAIVEGVHFLPGDPIDLIAKKALRVNFSDLVAKGAKPVGVLLTLIWPKGRDAAEISRFAKGLAEDLDQFHVALLGGDTTSTDGPLVVSVTAFGEPLGDRVPSRADACVGEDVWTTGNIGDAVLGLMTFTEAREFATAMPVAKLKAHTIEVQVHGYWCPIVQFALLPTIAQFARASTDVSDGLIADAGNIARASGVQVRINADAIPLSSPGRAFVATHGSAGLVRLATGGDDYQVLFTAAPKDRDAIQEAALAVGVAVTLIGDVRVGVGVQLLDAAGEMIATTSSGHTHKLGS